MASMAAWMVFLLDPKITMSSMYRAMWETCSSSMMKWSSGCNRKLLNHWLV